MRVRVAANFERNLDEIERFLQDSLGFDQLLDTLFGTVMTNLEQFPAIGFDLLARSPGSFEGLAQAEALRRRLGAASLREYISGDYLLLYSLEGDEIVLLSIKHHRQLSFDLRALW